MDTPAGRLKDAARSDARGERKRPGFGPVFGHLDELQDALALPALVLDNSLKTLLFKPKIFWHIAAGKSNF